jgi:hypothetical protein
MGEHDDRMATLRQDVWGQPVSHRALGIERHSPAFCHSIQPCHDGLRSRRDMDHKVRLVYASGEIVLPGDRVRYARHDGEVEFVADPEYGERASWWYVDQFGGGCMVRAESFGRMFFSSTSDEQDLEFVARA